jgi:PPOX class probable F420-dependent enzyme
VSKLTPEQRALFEGKNFVTIATTGKDGGPRATNVWVDIDDKERIVLNTAQNRAWPRNLKRDPRVALNVFDLSDPYKKITVLGHVDETTTEGAVDHIHKLARKYRGEDYVGDMDRVIFKIAIDKIHTFGV